MLPPRNPKNFEGYGLVGSGLFIVLLMLFFKGKWNSINFSKNL